jgi:hypothetical protein
MTPEEAVALTIEIEDEIGQLIDSGEWSLERYETMVDKMQPVLAIDPSAIEVVAKHFNLDW